MTNQKAGEEARVFVNNQNTRVATVTLPTLTKRSGGRADEGLNDNSVSEGSESEKKGVNGYQVLKGVGKAPSARDIHPRLEGVYHRVMRQLQRRANYGGVGAPPLNVRLGVENDKEFRAMEKGFEADELMNSTLSLMSASLAEAVPESGRLQTNPQLVGKNLILSNPVSGEDGDEGALLAKQPCPKTLRLIVEEVTNTIVEKLKIAQIGSIKACLCQVFESRALLDRLLKEIPSYSQFQGDGERLLTPMKLQELYQEFRKRPTILPNACYVRDPENGSVRACTGDMCIVANDTEVPPANEQTVPVQQEQPTEQVKNLMVSQMLLSQQSVSLMGTWVGSEAKKTPPVSFSEAAIPATYGKSSRVTQNVGAPKGRSAVDMKLKFSNIQLGTAAPGNIQLELDSGGESTSGREKEESTLELSATAPTSRARCVGGRDPQQCSPGVPARPHELSEVAKCHRETRYVSVGVVTDNNSTTTVPCEQYDELLRHIESLYVEIEEKKREITLLREELSEEQQYTSRKKKVVQYLRETLYRECSALRSQLTLAQQKQIQYQGMVKDQQRILAGVQVSPLCAQPPANTYGMDRKRINSFSKYEFCRPPSALPKQGVHDSARGMNGSTNELARRMTQGGLQTHKRLGAPSEERDDFTSVDDPSTDNGSVNTARNVSTAENRAGGLTRSMSVTRDQVFVDCTAVQSLLDLVLLAVENDQVLPVTASRARNANMEIIGKAMVTDPATAERRARKRFEFMQQRMKENYARSRGELLAALSTKEKEISKIQNATDKQYIERFLRGQVEGLRVAYRRIRRATVESLKELWNSVYLLMDSVLNRATVVDASLRDNERLYTSFSALQDLVASASSLIGPMLTTEYSRGYHPWPLKLRNTPEPFRVMLRVRYGDAQLQSIHEEVNALNDLYVTAHQYITRNYSFPQLKRPAVGSTLRYLCAMLVLNSATTNEVWQQVSEKFNREKKLQRHIALLNFSLVSMMYRQRVLGERSAAALREAGMDMKLVGLPVQRRVNRIAEELHRVLAERSTVRRQRVDNARDIYRIWKATQINIYEGYAVPSMPPRLALVRYDGRGAVEPKPFASVSKAGGDAEARLRMTRDALRDTHEWVNQEGEEEVFTSGDMM